MPAKTMTARKRRRRRRNPLPGLLFLGSILLLIASVYALYVYDLLSTYGFLVAAVIAGSCALTAAYIRRDRRWERWEEPETGDDKDTTPPTDPYATRLPTPTEAVNECRDQRSLRSEMREAAPSDLVHFSAFVPPEVRPGSQFLLGIWAHLEAQREQMVQRASQGGRAEEVGSKGPVPVERGSLLTICLDLPGFMVEESMDTIHWTGAIANATFAVGVPGDLRAGTHVGKAQVLLGAVPVARLSFSLTVGAGDVEASPQNLPLREDRIRTAFASYASADRINVLQWARGAQSVGVDVFLDVLSLREGQNWEQELWRQVSARDAFFLCWSEAARQSPWVEKEWRCALKERGLDYIHPVPFADPRDVPPPPELSAWKHFNDLARIVLEYEKGRVGDPT